VLLAVGAGTFTWALDGSIVNTALPVIRAAFGVEFTTIEWVLTVYLLVVSGLLLSFGRLGDLHGHRRVYTWGFSLFLTGALLSGLAPAAWALVVTRALQAVGAAMLFANAPALLTLTFPAEQRGQALGLQATLTYLGLTSGPAIGGWIAGALGWRWVFLIALPAGLLALALTLRFVPADRPAGRAEPFDWAGATTFLLGLVTLLLALNQGHAWGWGSARIRILLAVAGVLLGLFGAIERDSAHPMLDPALLRSRVFSLTTVSAMLNYMAVSGITFLLPFYLIEGRGLGPGAAGLVLTAQPAVMSVAAPLAGSLSDRIGSRGPAVLGLAILAVALLLLSRIGATTPIPAVAATLGLAGLGSGIFIAPNNSALMGAAPRNRQGIAAAVLASARNVGMVLGVGIAGAVFATATAGSAGAAAVAGSVGHGFLIGAAIVAAGAVTSFLARPERVDADER